MTNHSFISSARLKIAAALAAAVMLAPVTVPAIGAVAASNTPAATTKSTQALFTSKLQDARASLASANALKKTTAWALSSNTDQANNTAYFNQIDAELDNIEADSKLPGADFDSLITEITAQNQKLTNWYGLWDTFLARNLDADAKSKMIASINTAKQVYDKLSADQQKTSAGLALLSAFNDAQKVYDASPTYNQAMIHMDDLTAKVKAVQGTVTGPVQRVQTAIDKLSDLAKTTPVFLLNLTDYKNSQNTIKEVQQLIKDGKITTEAQAIMYEAQVNGSYNNLSNAIKRALSFTGVGTINYVPKYGIQVWTWDGKLVMMDNDKTKAKKLQHGTRWKIFGDIINQNGSRMYNLGGDQFIDANFINYKANK